MKFFHVGDLHLGKMLHNIPLVEEDQPFWAEQLIRAVDEYSPDAVVMAGDIYDRRVPPVEAMALFDHLLTELAKREIYVFVIPGNHDSAVRLAHVSDLLTSHRIFIAGELQRELTHVTVPGDRTDVTFWLMPYIFPKIVSDRKVLDRDDLSTYDEAARALLSAQDLDENACNVLVAHQNVLSGGKSPEHSESETYIGGLGEIDCSAFDAFDYVALGHIHNAQKIGRETVRYAGCPLYYDFSEISRSKGLTMVTIGSKDDIRIDRIDIPIRHRLLQKTGTLEELLASGAALEDKDQYYIQCILCDRHVPPRALDRLKAVYGDSLVNVKRSIPGDAGDPDGGTAQGGEGRFRSLEDQFAAFYQEQQQELLDEDQEKIVKRILDQQARRGGDYLLDVKSIPLTDSQELLDFLRTEQAEKVEEWA